jgi:hypothetical protein
MSDGCSPARLLVCTIALLGGSACGGSTVSDVGDARAAAAADGASAATGAGDTTTDASPEGDASGSDAPRDAGADAPVSFHDAAVHPDAADTDAGAPCPSGFGFVPLVGSACAAEGLACSYGGMGPATCASGDWTCAAGVWTCNPVGCAGLLNDQCPVTLPESGTECSADFEQCFYAVDAGGCGVQVCGCGDSTGAWWCAPACVQPDAGSIDGG